MANISLEVIQISYIERGIGFVVFLQNRLNTQSCYVWHMYYADIFCMTCAWCTYRVFVCVWRGGGVGGYVCGGGGVGGWGGGWAGVGVGVGGGEWVGGWVSKPILSKAV